MQYEFDFGTFFIGLVILIAGILFLKWHQKIADNLGSGVSSYDHFKLFALITCGVGILVTFNLHWFILGNILLLIFPSLKLN